MSAKGGHDVLRRTTLQQCFEISFKDAEREIQDSPKALEDSLSNQALSFAYPYGRLNDNVKRITMDAGYRFGVASDSGPDDSISKRNEHPEIYAAEVLFRIKMIF
jgi:peptidoglycan/xylan/chitin deacetylase (PgdA/CDA1 family)